MTTRDKARDRGDGGQKNLSRGDQGYGWGTTAGWTWPGRTPTWRPASRSTHASTKGSYERLGFEVAGEQEVLGVPSWFMLRWAERKEVG